MELFNQYKCIRELHRVVYSRYKGKKEKEVLAEFEKIYGQDVSFEDINFDSLSKDDAIKILAKLITMRIQAERAKAFCLRIMIESAKI